MKITQLKKIITLKISGVMLLILATQTSFAQPSLTISITDLLNWQSSSITQQNVSLTPLSHKVKFPNYQIINGLDTNTKILYSPDGMNNFGPYIDSSNQFNLFNFSHWQYIDILAWFGGSASTPIVIPAKAWVDAAHKNGVKVIGTVFFAPSVYGGSQAQVQSFLQQDVSGNFIAAQKLIDIANYYNFDGWMINAETAVNNSTGALLSTFENRFDSAYSGEVIWYDAMIQNGNVSYQNMLNSNNSYFFRHSTGLFTNYSWSAASTVQSSHNYANSLGLSPFRVYTGADMWPNRNAQPAFSNYTWIDNIITNSISKTSIALFATNFTYNYSSFSNFNNDPNDYNNFYKAEREIFSGIDQDPFTTDNNAWKGIGYYLPVRTTITSFPFQTDFNTGHGLNYYNNGSILTTGAWHNMSHQNILPSWTFYANGVTINYSFTDAFAGGSSLTIVGTAGGNYTIPLYSTNMVTAGNSLNTELAIKSAATSIDSIAIEYTKKNTTTPALAVFHPASNGNWEDLLDSNLAVTVSDTIIAIKLHIYANAAFNANIGRINVDEALVTAANKGISKVSTISVYPNPSTGNVTIINTSNKEGQLNITDILGNKIINQRIKKEEKQLLTLPCNGVYLYEFKSENEYKQGKIIID